MIHPLFALIASAALVNAGAEWLYPQEHAALMNIYNALGCSREICPRFVDNMDCEGSRLVCSAHRVIELKLGTAQLNGTLPSDIGVLTAITDLSLFGNNIKGMLTPEVGKLTKLRSLSLSGNQFVGAVPSELGQLEFLNTLLLANNRFAGTMPKELKNLFRLSELRANNNLFTGAIPPFPSLDLGRCTLQASNDTNQLDCSTKPAGCQCEGASAATTPTAGGYTAATTTTLGYVAATTTTTMVNTTNPFQYRKDESDTETEASTAAGMSANVIVAVAMGLIGRI